MRYDDESPADAVQTETNALLFESYQETATRLSQAHLTKFNAARHVPILEEFTALRRLELSHYDQLSLHEDRNGELENPLVPTLRKLPSLNHLSLASHRADVRLSPSWSLSGGWPSLRSLHVEGKVLNAEIISFITSQKDSLEILSLKIPRGSQKPTFFVDGTVWRSLHSLDFKGPSTIYTQLLEILKKSPLRSLECVLMASIPAERPL